MKILPCCLIAAGAMLALFACNSDSPPPTPTPAPTPAPIPTPAEPPVSQHDPVPTKELMITDLSVVNDARTQGPDGPWSFGGLMKRLAGGGDPKPFVLDWLANWEQPRVVNGQTAPARPAIRNVVIEAWKTRDGQAGVTDAAWNMNLANAPFRLLAIVNRIDLNRIDDPVDKTCGEGRFVFGVTAANGSPLLFTVIFEYRLVGTDQERLRGWAREWHALGQLSFGAQYNAALQVITDKFSGAGFRLNQLRTNEIALNGLWELREFQLISGRLVQTPTLQTPPNSVDGTDRLTRFINANEVEILDGTVRVPVQFESTPFLAANSQVPFNFKWAAPGVGNPDARHKFAVLTCNGCHHVETGTGNFLHVANRAAGQTSELSKFLTGKAADGDEFHDLEDRAGILKDLATQPGDIRLNAVKVRRARVH